jgi:membrane fusion protein (multidrug efflux system)
LSSDELAETTATARRTSQDLERLKPLIAKDEISRQQYDAAVAAQEAAQAVADSAKAAVNEAQANVSVAEARRSQAASALVQAQAEAKAASTAPEQVALTRARADTADAQVLQARAAVDQARVTLERTMIRAPGGGIVSRKTVEAGQIIQPGQPLLALTSLDDVWVTANFKETQLDRMHAGQAADVDVDTYGRTFSGHIDSIAAATGATFSLLPPDNASGNFVKVVQRLPVKIALAPGQNSAGLLRPGMSATVTVYLK